MVKKQGKFIDTHGIVDVSDYIPQLAVAGEHDIVATKEESWLSILLGWAKGSILFIVIGLLFLALLYSGLSATLMSYVKTGPHSPHSLVVRGTWSSTGSIPPVYAKAVISDTTFVPTNWWGNIVVGWMGIKNPSIVKIMSGPYDKIAVVNSKVSNLTNNAVGGGFVSSPEFTYNSTKNNDISYTLKGEYLVQCISGTCQPGTYFIINPGQVYGEVKKL